MKKPHIETYWAIIIWRSSHAPYLVREARVTGNESVPRFFATREKAREFIRDEEWPEGSDPKVVKVVVAETNRRKP